MRTRLPTSRRAVLERVPLFTGLTDAELALVDRLAVEIEVDAGQALAREGEIGRQSFIVVDGELVVTIAGDAVAKLRSGDLFGEMSVLEHLPRTATVTTLTPTRVLVITPDALSTLLETGPVGTRVLRTLVRRLHAAQQRV